VASIIGRVFAVSWLWGVHPDLGSTPRVRANLEALARLDLTPIETYEPELRCLFKHVMIQEVAYESLPFALRAQLHERLACWLEERTTADPALDLLAFHYGRSGNLPKQREYFRRAGEAAAARYANAAAVDYYERLLALLDVAEHVEARIDALGAIGEELQRTGALDTADQRYREALSLAASAGNLREQARAQLGLGVVRRMRGTYAEALPCLEQARAAFAALDDPHDSVKTLMQIAYVYFFQGSAEQARALAEEARKLALQYGETHIAGQALHLLGNLARNRDDRDAAQALWTESIAVKHTIQDKLGIAATLANMGLMFYELGDLLHARSLIEESQGLFRDLGARREHALVRGMLAPVLLAQGRADEARQLLIENLVVLRDLGARWELARDLVGLAQIAVETDPSVESAQYALRLSSAAASQLEAIGGVFPVASDRARMERAIELARSRLEAAAGAAAWAEGWGMSWPEAIAFAINPFRIAPIAQLELEVDHSV
jgi:tetratricopeptide (TPR) repeat protein